MVIARLRQRGRDFNRGVGMLAERARNVRENPRSNRVERAASGVATYGAALYPGRTGQPARAEIQQAATRTIQRGGPAAAVGQVARYTNPATTFEARLGAGLAAAGPLGRPAARGAGLVARGVGRRAARGLGDDVASGATRGARDFGNDLAGRSRSVGRTGRSVNDVPSSPARRRFPTGRVALGGAAILGVTTYQLGQESVSTSSGDTGGSAGPGGGTGPGGSEGGAGLGFEDPFLGATEDAGFGAASAAGEGGGLAALASSGIVAVGVILLLAMGDN